MPLRCGCSHPTSTTAHHNASETLGRLTVTANPHASFTTCCLYQPLMPSAMSPAIFFSGPGFISGTHDSSATTRICTAIVAYWWDGMVRYDMTAARAWGQMQGRRSCSLAAGHLIDQQAHELASSAGSDRLVLASSCYMLHGSWPAGLQGSRTSNSSTSHGKENMPQTHGSCRNR